MSRFRFRLDGVLRHRVAVEKERLREYTAVLARLRALEDELAGLQRLMREANDDLRANRLVGPIDVSFIAAHRRFLLGVQRKGTEVVGRMAAAKKEEEAARAALAEAAKQRKVLEKLREGQERRWREEQGRREAALLDEAAMQIAFADLSAGAPAGPAAGPVAAGGSGGDGTAFNPEEHT